MSHIQIWLALAFGAMVWGQGLALAQADPEPRLVETRLTVHVSGAVRRPGLYRLPPGTRVADAIQAAGGPLRGAGVADLELAAALRDGESVRVPASPAPADAAPAVRRTDRAPGARPARHAGHARARRAPPRHAPSGRAGPVDLNRASLAELQRLPGVGPGLAARIVAYRKRAGRYASVEELREVPGIGEKRLARLSGHAVVR